MTESEQQEILATLKECIVADPNVRIGPVTKDLSPHHSGLWVPIGDILAYLGASVKAAMLTAQQSDWWIPSRDGPLTEDDVEWFEVRATFGEAWEQNEIPLFKEERRRRLALNIQLATTDDLGNE
ncbi:MAG: hypothetical protein R3C18_07170 [Planctomycetaceae bacterium]